MKKKLQTYNAIIRKQRGFGERALYVRHKLVFIYIFPFISFKAVIF